MSSTEIAIFRIEPAAAWVREREVDYKHQESGSSPFLYLLVDYQDHIAAGRIESYSRTVQKINDASRLEDASLLTSELNEEHQRVIFHSIEIIRDGQRINALDEENISVYQRETSLESHIVTGRKTVALTIDDLRKGDILDVCMTTVSLQSTHPLHGRYYVSTFWLNWACPVLQQIVRVINRGEFPLIYQHRKPADDLQSLPFEELENGADFEQIYTDLIPKSIDPTAPRWIWSEFLQFTSKQSWPEISRYLYNYYAANGVLDTKIDIAGIDLLELSGDLETDALSVIRFVQNNVRYRGENHGIYTHVPKSPERTLKKRAGDCKDKSNLLATMLRSLGIDARLVLVSTGYGEKIASLGPSAYQFNHMIVRLLHEGKYYYFDPTIQQQAGDFKHCAELSYGYVLELTAAGSDLEEIPYDYTKKVFDLKHEFDFTQHKKDASTLSISRSYYAHRADNMRFYLNSKEQAALEADYLKWAKEETGMNLEAIKPLAIVSDDAIKNLLITEERYQISGLKKTHKENQANLLTDFYTNFPISSNSDYPVAINVEGALSHEIKVRTTRAQQSNQSKQAVNNAYFEYQDIVVPAGNELNFKTVVIPKRPYVERADLQAYEDDVQKMQSRSRSLFAYSTPLLEWSYAAAIAVAFVALWGLKVLFALFKQ